MPGNEQQVDGAAELSLSRPPEEIGAADHADELPNATLSADPDDPQARRWMPSHIARARAAKPTQPAHPSEASAPTWLRLGPGAWPSDTDRYRLGPELARGGLGYVAVAHDRKLDRTVAVKRLHRLGAEAEARFLNEARITARLQHPSIVPVYDVGTYPNGEPYYAMKLIEGRTLKELIGQATTFEDRLALVPHVAAIADAVGYAHSRGVVHRDLKPANIIVGEHNVQYAADWGLAKELDHGDDPSPDVAEPYRLLADADLTVAGAVLGTPAFMAPEQARGEAVDQRADVYALGAILYNVLAECGVFPPRPTGRVPLVRSASRTERHFRDSFSSVRMAIARAISRWLPRCPAYHRHRHTHAREFHLTQ